MGTGILELGNSRKKKKISIKCVRTETCMQKMSQFLRFSQSIAELQPSKYSENKFGGSGVELDSRCEVVTSDKSHTTKRLYQETDYRKNSILNQAYFTVYTIKSALIFLLVDIYTMHRINTFSVIFRVSVKMSEV